MFKPPSTYELQPQNISLPCEILIIVQEKPFWGSGH